MGRTGEYLGMSGESWGDRWVHEVRGVLGEKGSFLPRTHQILPRYHQDSPKHTVVHRKFPHTRKTKEHRRLW